jgi:hypothetical protein
MEEREWKREQLRRLDEARREGRIERAVRTKVHGVIPNHFFSAASTECRETFIDGHFYACISLAQAVAEGLSRFLDGFHPVGAKKDPPQQTRRLARCGAISDGARDALLRIWGNDRNTFHHMNQDVTTDPEELERRAEECVNALFEIESELFAYETPDGKLAPKNPHYWPRLDEEHMEVFLRLVGH